MKKAKEMTFEEIANELDTLRGQTQKPAGPRAIFVVDRGWIFAGDAAPSVGGYVRLERAVHVFKWESIGFAKMIEEWKGGKVDLRPIAPVELPESSIIFRIPTSDDWGIK